MSALNRGRTTRDGNLELVQKPGQPEPAADPFGTDATSGAGDAGSGGAGGSAGGGYGGGGYGGSYAQLDPLATAALICGVLGFVMICCCGLFTLLLSPLAIILGIVSLVRIKNNPENLSGVGMAWAGIGTGAAGLAFYALYFLFVGGVQLVNILQQM